MYSTVFGNVGQRRQNQTDALDETIYWSIQIYNEARKFAQGSMVKPVVAYGGTSTGYQARKLAEGCNILVATPGRRLDYVDKGKVSFSSLQFLVLVEADRMLGMGFMPETFSKICR